MHIFESYTDNTEYQSSMAGRYAFLTFSFILILFSPLLSWAYSLLLLIMLSNVWKNVDRKILGVSVVLSGALIIGSREVFIGPDDFRHYYQMFEQLARNDLKGLFNYGQGFEIGLPMYYLVLSTIFGDLSPSMVVFYTVLLAGLLYLLWLEKYALDGIKESQKALAVASSLVFFSFLLSSQLMRQMLAMILLLYALYSSNKISMTLFLLLASSFHLTAIVFFIIIKMIFLFPRNTFIFTTLGTSIFIFMQTIVFEYFRGNWHIPIIHKMSHYSHLLTEFTATDLLYMKYILILFFLYVFFPTNNELRKRWKYVVITFSALYFLLLPIALGATRVTLIIHSVMFGYLLFLGIRNYVKPFQIILSIYVIYRVFQTFKTTAGFQLWQQYDWIGFPFMYYFMS